MTETYPCDRCAHPYAKHSRHVQGITVHGCSVPFGLDDKGRQTVCPCDGYFPAREAAR